MMNSPSFTAGISSSWCERDSHFAVGPQLKFRAERKPLAKGVRIRRSQLAKPVVSCDFSVQHRQINERAVVIRAGQHRGLQSRALPLEILVLRACWQRHITQCHQESLMKCRFSRLAFQLREDGLLRVSIGDQPQRLRLRKQRFLQSSGERARSGVTGRGAVVGSAVSERQWDHSSGQVYAPSRVRVPSVPSSSFLPPLVQVSCAVKCRP